MVQRSRSDAGSSVGDIQIQTVVSGIPPFLFEHISKYGTGISLPHLSEGYPIRHPHAALQHPVSITASLLILARIIQNYCNLSVLNGF